MRFRCGVFFVGLLLATLAAVFQVHASPAYPLKASASGRYLVDSNDVPVLLTGDSPQALFVKLSEAEAGVFLTNRAALGFNSLWVNLLCTTNNGGLLNGATTNGIAPFTNTIPATGKYDLTTPNEAYFAHVDRVISLAGQLGIQIMLGPLETSVDVWTSVARANGTNRCRAFGQYLGNRYKNFDNIIWWNGNDFQDWTSAASETVVRAIALGIRDVDVRHLHTLMLDYPVSGSLDNTNWASILGLNASYTYWPTYAQVLNDYNRTNFIPTFMAEAHYEFEDLYLAYGNPEVMRRQAYWSLLSGACGQFMGNHYTWQFLPGWQTNMNTTGSLQMAHVNSLFDSRPWYDLVPDQSHTVLTAGYGTFASSGTLTNNTYATAARTPDGALVMAYLPTVRTVTMDMTKLGAAASAQWFDPANGTYTPVSGSPFANTGTRTFTPPGTNSMGAGDWVLVLEAPLPDAIPPTAPPTLTAQAVNLNQINLHWSAATDNIAVTQYRVERCAGIDCAGFVPLVTLSGTNYADVGLLPGTFYRYRVAALDAATNVSAYSAVATGRTWIAPPVWSGLVADYAFDEGAGTVSADISGNGNTAWIDSANWTTAGRFNAALEFDGLNFATASNSPSLQLTGGVTLEAWIYPKGEPTNWATLVMKETETGFAYALRVDSAGRPGIFVETSGDTSGVTGAGALPPNTWAHLVGTYDGAMLALFVDGIPVASNAVAGSMVASTGPVRIGGNPVVGEFFTGKLDGVRIYNRALSDGEIQTNRNRAAGPLPVVTLHPQAQTSEQVRQAGYRFGLSADSAVAVAIEATTNFVTWQPVTALQYTNGLLEVVDPGNAPPALGFYRVRAVGGSSVITLDVAPQSASQIAAEGFKLTVTADGPASLVVERSTDFVVWEPISELAYTNGPTVVSDAVVRFPTFRFYRARLQ